MSGQRIIITGAASGIAAATLTELRRTGARVVGLDRNAGTDGLIACDVRDQSSVDAAVADAIDQLGGGLDVLINCAGLATPQSAGEAPDARALAVIDINLVGPWRVTSAALPALRASRGRVVNVASGMAYVAMPFAPAYAMSKHGVVAYSRRCAWSTATRSRSPPSTPATPNADRPRLARIWLDAGRLLARGEAADVAAAMVRAALSDPPRGHRHHQDRARTVALTRFAPRGFVERTILRTVGKAIRGRSFDGAPSRYAIRHARREPGRRAQ